MTSSKPSRQHSFQAYRVMSRPTDFAHYRAQVKDLVEDIHDESVQASELDVDGTSMVALALRGWEDMRDRELRQARYASPASNGGLSATPPWQRPAQALIAKGANPFDSWPAAGELAWGADADSEHARCGVMAAIQEQAWDVLEQCLSRPVCPTAHAFDAVRAIHGKPLLQIVLNSSRGLELLLEHGLNPNETDPNGRTPIFHAQDPEVVERLLKFGADPQATDDQGNDAPTHWGLTLKAPTPLVEVWQTKVHANEAPRNGRMVVSTLRSNSVKAMEAALKASGWAPDMPVDPDQHPTRRLLPAAAMVMLQHARGAGQAVPVAPLRELLNNARFSNIWTAEEKAWAACALVIIQGMAEHSHAFTSTSQATVSKLLEQLMGEPEVALLVGSSFAPMIQAMDLKQGHDHQAVSWWKAWLSQLPLQAGGNDPSVNGVASLPELWKGPKAVAEEVSKAPSSLNRELFNSLAQEGFVNMDADLLLACLLLRAGEGYSDRLVEPDQAWRQAWSALPTSQAFTMDNPLIKSMIEDMLEGEPESVHEGLTWKQWALDTRLMPATPKDRKLRF